MIRTSQASIYVAAISHPGLAGRENEDRFAISSYRVSETNPTPSIFAIISDGIGGHLAGEVAAEMAVETISQMVAQSNARHPLEILDQAIQVSSEAISLQARDDTQRLGMGTTCACAWLIGRQLFIASVGDSRIYLLRNGDLVQLTVDHTWIQEAIEKGVLKPEDAPHNPNQHVLRRYLGSSRIPKADTRLRLTKNESDTQARSNQGLDLIPGDLLLLCSDGLTDVVGDHEIEPLVRGLDLQSAAQALVDQATSRKGKDNITVILMLIPSGSSSPQKSTFWFWALLGFVVLVLFALLITTGTWIAWNYLLPVH
jgi:PPM family protein phosphatase